MTVNNLFRLIKNISSKVKTVASSYDGDVYTIWNTGEVKYASFVVALSNSVKRDNLRAYNLLMYYGDRLIQDGSNKNSVWDDAINTLQTIVNKLCTIDGIDTDGDYQFTPFEQKFEDNLAGAYVDLTLLVEDSLGECGINDIFIDWPDFGSDSQIPSIIDDNKVVTNQTWSSFKINEEITTLGTEISDLGGRVTTLEGTVSGLGERMVSVEETLAELGDFTCGEIVPTTTNFVEGTTYTIHEALQRTANLFGGIQGEIDSINALIPNQATTQNQLADKSFVNSTVAANAANFRGNWADWASVPTNVIIYPEDYTGSRTPTNNDYLVVQDASYYINPEILAHQLSVVNLHETKKYIIGVTDESGEYHEYYYNDGFLNTWKSISPEYSLMYRSGAPGIWYIKTNKPEDTRIIVNKVVYENANESASVLLKNNSPTTPVVVGLPAEVGQYQGPWRFIYVGDWATSGILGWKPQYQIGSAFTAEQQAAIDSGITSTKVATYDGYGAAITALQTDKLDKNYTANKIYGTDSLGSQTVYTLGDGLGFNNGQIVNTRTSAAWGNITGTLSNQTDLQNALDSKQDVLSAGTNIVISDNEISAVSQQINIPNNTLSQELNANVLYVFENRTNNLTIALKTAITGAINEYHMFIHSGDTAPTITWPAGLKWYNDVVPIIMPNKIYEVSILNNTVIFVEI